MARLAGSLLVAGLGLVMAKDTTPPVWSACNTTSGVDSIKGFSWPNLQKNAQMTSDQYIGNVLMIVNVASFWGHTYQYPDFNGLLDTYSAQGFKILAFPCNQFLNQEPGREDEILNSLRYVRPGNNYVPHPEIHFSAKVVVNDAFVSFGPQNKIHPLFAYLKGKCPAPVPTFRPVSWYLQDNFDTRDIFWNFEKFLVDAKGTVRFRIAPNTWGQHGEAVQPFIEQLLKEKNNPTGNAGDAAAKTRAKRSLKTA